MNQEPHTRNAGLSWMYPAAAPDRPLTNGTGVVYCGDPAAFDAPACDAVTPPPAAPLTMVW